MSTHRIVFLFALFVGLIPFNVVASIAFDNQDSQEADLDPLLSLVNFQQNTSTLFSSGLPNPAQLTKLKHNGISHVVDLIPGDRSKEIIATAGLNLHYFNIPVDWEAPSLANFLNYVAYMEGPKAANERVLTHCKLNWRGASFTYLYRIAVLNEDETKAKIDLMAIWHPNPTWYAFMNEVITHFNTANGTNVTMSFDAALEDD